MVSGSVGCLPLATHQWSRYPVHLSGEYALSHLLIVAHGEVRPPQPSPYAVTYADVVSAASNVHLNIALQHSHLFSSLAFARFTLAYCSVACMMQCLSGGASSEAGGGMSACGPDAGSHTDRRTPTENSKVRNLFCPSIYTLSD